MRDRFISAHAKLYQHLQSRPDSVPLSPVASANAPPDLFVEITKLRLIQAVPKIADPALKITPAVPPFRPSLTRGYAQQISPNKGRELSLRKCVVYRWSLSEYGFVVLWPLATGSLLASTTFLFVSPRSFGVTLPAAKLARIAGFLPTVRHLAADQRRASVPASPSTCILIDYIWYAVLRSSSVFVQGTGDLGLLTRSGEVGRFYNGQFIVAARLRPPFVDRKQVDRPRGTVSRDSS